MGRKIELSLQEIINRVGVLEFANSDFDYIFNDLNVANEFFNVCVNAQSNDNFMKPENYIIEHEEYVNKENLLLILAKNCRYSIETCKNIIEAEDRKNPEGHREVLKKITTISEATKKMRQLEESLKEITKISKGIDNVIAFYSYTKDKKSYQLDIVDSREFIDGKHINYSKNKKRFEKLDETFKSIAHNDEVSLKYLLGLLDLEKLYKVFITEEFGKKVVRKILENRMLEVANLLPKEFEYIREHSLEQYKQILDTLDGQEFSQDILEEVMGNSRYVNVDKILLMASKKFEEALERGFLKDKEAITVGFILEKILNEIEDKKVKIEDEETLYSIQDIQECLERFTNDSYLSKSKIQQFREKVKSGEMDLSEIPPEYIEIVFSDEELEEITVSTIGNLEYAFEKSNMSNEEIARLIIEAYEEGEISIDKIGKLKFLYNLSEEIKSEKLNEYFISASKEEATEEEKEQYKRYLELYKEVLIKDKTKEKLEESSNSIMENLINYYNEKDKEFYIRYIEDYYKEGLLTLDSIVDWNGEDVVTRLYSDKIIDLGDVLSIGLKLGFEYIHNLYIELINSNDTTYDERINYIGSGFIGEEEVINLYNQGMIMDSDLIALADKAIIRKEIAIEILDSRQLEDRIKTARAKATGWEEQQKVFNINGLRKKQNENFKYMFGTGDREKEKSIIDPNLRQEFIEMLGLYRINVSCEEDSPFYHYEFYATPDETGAIGANSVIIAERYYNNKFSERTFSTNNATYFFKYKDFLVLSNLQKKDMLEERENVVFRANHTITTNTKQGNWAKSVLDNMLRTMLGSDLKYFSEKEKREKLIEKMRQMYLKEEVDDIFSMSKRIDSGEGILIIEKQRRHSPNFDDDNGLR